MSSYYIAFDPGPVVGWATWYPETNEFRSGEVPYREARYHARKLFCLVPCPPEDLTLITERFSITSRTLKGKVYYESLYFNGWLDLECLALTGVHPADLVWGMPAVAKAETEVPSKGGRNCRHLKELGWYLKTKDGHANDAAAHILHQAKTYRQPYVLETLA